MLPAAGLQPSAGNRSLFDDRRRGVCASAFEGGSIRAHWGAQTQRCATREQHAGSDFRCDFNKPNIVCQW